MKYMMTYDLMESTRNTYQWLGGQRTRLCILSDDVLGGKSGDGLAQGLGRGHGTDICTDGGQTRLEHPGDFR